MNAPLPPGLSAADFARAMDRFRSAVGDKGSADGLDDYLDPYPLGDPGRGAASAALLPASTEQVQEVVRIAADFGIPLWTVSRGKNLGYGGAAPRVRGSVVVDLSRMNQVIEVNDELCYAIVEPGVTFFDLYNHVRERGLNVWPSCPALGWGSVIGNTLERGWGYTPLGEHANQQCGMEVVLPDGDVIRTGMGAIGGGRAWAVFKGGYGPAADSLFMQSNFGIVTKMGIWLYPQPEAFLSARVDVDSDADLPRLVDILARLQRTEVLQNHPLIGNVVRHAASIAPRSHWYQGPGAMPDSVVADIRRQLGIGAWHARFALYGAPAMIAARWAVVREAFAGLPGARLTERTYSGQDGAGLLAQDVDGPDRGGQAGFPSLLALESVKFRGDNGAHIGFSPVLPANGAEVLAFYRVAKEISAKHGFDFYPGFHCYPRHLVHINMIIFDADDAGQREGAAALFRDLVAAARAHGYSEYRAHTDFMDLVADQFDFNGHALRRFNERIKDALDPRGILSPGKQGIWPAGSASRQAREHDG
jgi:4-cresol dehydrogenase (hydroxylating) flavoprotein subunit